MRKRGNKKLIIFDLDGTLIDAYPAIIRSFNYTMQRFGYPRQNALVIRRAVGWGDGSLLKPFLEPGDLKKALLVYRNHHKTALIKRSRLFPKAKTLLRHLKERGYKLAVASNRPTQFSWILIRHLEISKFFDYVLCSDKLRKAKPHPEILHKIMQRLGVNSSQTLCVGDMTIDAQAGRRARLKTIIVTTGSNTKAEIQRERPNRIIQKISDLLKIL